MESARMQAKKNHTYFPDNFVNMSHDNFSPENLPDMSTDDLLDMSPEDLPDLSTDNLPNLSTDNLPDLSTDNLPDLSTDDLQDLLPEGSPNISSPGDILDQIPEGFNDTSLNDLAGVIQGNLPGGVEDIASNLPADISISSIQDIANSIPDLGGLFSRLEGPQEDYHEESSHDLGNKSVK